jgi:hypothetical protein
VTVSIPDLIMTFHLSVAGLIIISAHYGLASAFTSTGLREIRGQEHKVVDVTVPVQALVNGGKLQISGGRGKVSGKLNLRRHAFDQITNIALSYTG